MKMLSLTSRLHFQDGAPKCLSRRGLSISTLFMMKRAKSVERLALVTGLPNGYTTYYGGGGVIYNVTPLH